MKWLGSRRFLLAAFVLLALDVFHPLPLTADDAAITALPVDQDKNWTLGISRFKAVNVSPQNRYLVSSYPLQLREKIISFRKHRFPEDELGSLRKAIVNAELKKQITNLLAMQKTRDEALFNETKEFQIKKINADYATNSAQTMARIAFLRNLDIGGIVVQTEKDIQLKDNGGQLFDPPPFSALRYCDEIDVDALLWGSVEEIQGYLYCEMYLFDRISEKNIFTFKEAGRPEELFASLDKSVADLITAVVGRDWATLLVDVDPTFSFIKINGVLAGMGTVEVSDLAPGEVTLDIESPGYADRREKITLKPQESRVSQFTLVKTSEAFILVDSIPPSADVYVNSLWTGKTPLVIQKPDILTRLAIRAEGFQDMFARIGPNAPDALGFPLVKTVIDFDKLKNAMRWRYYTALAAFLLAVPLPVFSFGLMRDYYQVGKMGEYEFFSAAYYWTFFITGALLVNSLYNLYFYINSRDKTVG